MSAPERITGHILIADDELSLASVLAERLGAQGHRVTAVADGRAALGALSAEPFDVALLDIVMPPPDGLELLRALSDDPEPPAVIITTGQGTIDAAVQAMRLGAFAYLSKPYRIAEFDLVIARALEHRARANETSALRAQVARAEGAPEFLTQYAPLRAVFAAATAAAARDMPVFIVGAAGTGKCALARAMHLRSPRAARPFVQLDEATLASDDADRLLFGVDQGEHVSAVRPSLATRGTLYLQDTPSLALRTQARLAHAIRDGRFRAQPGGEERSVRCRLIAASNQTATDSRPMHRDLANELSATVITLPRLAERAVDIPLLAAAFLSADGDSPAARFDADAMAALEQYPWPGNVAELRAVVERARLLARGGMIRVVDLALEAHGDELELAEVERRHIESVLKAKRWHQGKTAESLGISPKTLYRKIRDFGLHRPAAGDSA